MAALELETDQRAAQPVVAQVAELQGEQEQRDSRKIRWQESKDQARSYKNSQGKEKQVLHGVGNILEPKTPVNIHS